MTTHAATYESLSSRSNAGAGSRPDYCFAQNVSIADITVAAGLILPRPLVPLSGYGGSPAPYASVDLMVNATVDTSYRAIRGSDFVSVNGVATDNNAEFLLPDNGVVENSGSLSPRLEINFNGAALAAGASTAQALVNYSYSSENLYLGITHFCEFQDNPPDTAPSGSTRLAQLLEQFSAATTRTQVGANAAGTAIIAEACGFAGCAPEGAVMVTPSDLGTGPDQIPPDIASNTAAAFRAHPSVFYPAGKTSYVRALTRGGFDPTSIVNDSVAGGPLQITSIIAAPTFSDWLVVVEGQTQIVRLAHPAGSDIRRPRDIWNQIWVPIIKGSSNVQSATDFASISGNGGALSFRWAYADYFRCLPIPGTNVIQTGGG